VQARRLRRPARRRAADLDRAARGRQQEALIGVLFVLAAPVGILLLAGNPHGGEHLKDLLVGQILWVGTPQLLALAVVTAVLLAAMAFGWDAAPGPLRLLRRFAVAVTASVQLVGVYLVFTSLIVPALATVRAGMAAACGLVLRCRTLSHGGDALRAARRALGRGPQLERRLQPRAATGRPFAVDLDPRPGDRIRRRLTLVQRGVASAGSCHQPPPRACSSAAESA
jgi:hypothetical protein